MTESKITNADWRKLEQEIVYFFTRGGYRPQKPLGQLEPHAGEWIVKYGKKPINLSALARDLAGSINPSGVAR